MFSKIPEDLTTTIYYHVQTSHDQAATSRTLAHVNIRDLVAAIRNISAEEIKYLEPFFDNKAFSSMDERIESVYTKLADIREPFVITSDSLECGYLLDKMARPQTPTQSCICLLRTLIKVAKDSEKKKVDEAIIALFPHSRTKPEFEPLTEQLSVPVTNADIQKWINSH